MARLKENKPTANVRERWGTRLKQLWYDWEAIMEPSKATSVNSRAEELFVQLFCEAFGPEKTENLQV